MKLRRRRGAYLDLVAWNCYKGNRDANVVDTLLQWADDYEPDVFALSECNTHADALAAFCRKRPYLLRQQPPPRWSGQGAAPAAGDCALLVRDTTDVDLLWRRVYRMKRLWMVFSHRQLRKPRRYEGAALRVRGRRWRVRDDHWPTNGFDGGNAAAFMESARSARRWLRAGLPGTPSVVVGDLNERKGRLSAWLGRAFAVFGKGIDLALTKRVGACEWQELGKGGGDHPGRRYRFHA